MHFMKNYKLNKKAKMKRKFITVQEKKKKRKLYLDDLNKIPQNNKKAYPKTPKFIKVEQNNH